MTSITGNLFLYRLYRTYRFKEAALGKPVTSSNHVMAWHASRPAGIDDKLPQPGRLHERRVR